MVLPSFVGIGAERCGSTWLHLLLKQHPKIYLPIRRKELNFFNLNYDKGLEWYQSFFPHSQEAMAYDAIGEISPRYLNFPECASRLADVHSIENLIVILRNPVNRAYSHYGHAVRISGYKKSFEEFIHEHPKALTNGLYAEHLQSFLKFYSSRSICFLIFEESVKNPEFTKKKIADFLQINVNNWSTGETLGKINKSYIPNPRLNYLNSLNSKAVKFCQDYNLDWIINSFKAIGFQKILQIRSSNLPKMSKESRLKLTNFYAKDIENLEKMLGRNFDIWYQNN